MQRKAFNYVIVSALCPFCISFIDTYKEHLQTANIHIILIDNLSYCVLDLLRALQVDIVPALHFEEESLKATDAFDWAARVFSGVCASCDLTGGTSIESLSRLYSEESLFDGKGNRIVCDLKKNIRTCELGPP